MDQIYLLDLVSVHHRFIWKSDVMGEKFIVAETGFSIYTGRVFKAIQGNNLKDFVFSIGKSGGQV